MLLLQPPRQSPTLPLSARTLGLWLALLSTLSCSTAISPEGPQGQGAATTPRTPSVSGDMSEVEIASRPGDSRVILARLLKQQFQSDGSVTLSGSPGDCSTVEDQTALCFFAYVSSGHGRNLATCGPLLQRTYDYLTTLLADGRLTGIAEWRARAGLVIWASLNVPKWDIPEGVIASIATAKANVVAYADGADGSVNEMQYAIMALSAAKHRLQFYARPPLLTKEKIAAAENRLRAFIDSGPSSLDRAQARRGHGRRRGVPRQEGELGSNGRGRTNTERGQEFPLELRAGTRRGAR